MLCCVLCLVAQSYLTLCDPMNCSPPGSSVQGNSPGKNIGLGDHALLQGIFQAQGSNPGLPHYGWILYHLSHQGSPVILEWVAYPFSRGLPQPRNRIGVSRIAGRSFTSWAARDSYVCVYIYTYICVYVCVCVSVYGIYVSYEQILSSSFYS